MTLRSEETATMKRRFGPILLALSLIPTVLSAQPIRKTDPASKNVYGSGFGLNIALTNSGFGFGGYLMRSVSETSSFLADFMITTVKDEREQRFFNFFGESIIPNKENYLHILPVQLGLQKRLFKESIEDNFRPYIHASGGPTLGWVSPYYDDDNGNGQRDINEDIHDIISAFPKGHMEYGVGGTIAIGANFGISKKVMQGIRFGYTFQWFPSGIQLLEPFESQPEEFFGTPTLTLSFGRLN
jgi:hypothetical protein